MARELAAAGHRVVGSLAEADLHVVNSCTVTAAAARSSRRAAGRGARQGGPRTVVTGCWATGQPEEAARLAGVDLVVPNGEKHRLVERIHQRFGAPAQGGDKPRPYGDAEPLGVASVGAGLVPALCGGHTRALLMIEDGCNMRCAFCIIPAMPGAQRSRPPAEVIAEARALLAAGHRELVVTGVQISAYESGGHRLVELVRDLLAGTDVPRLRLTSSAPWDLDERLLDLWQDRRLCRHLLLSLQSGSTPVLP